MGKVVMISSPAKDNLDLMIDKMAPAMNRQSIIIVHPTTWEEFIDELMVSGDDDITWRNTVDNGCSYKGVAVYRSQDYPVGQWGIYL
jgi:hypothetical protein